MPDPVADSFSDKDIDRFAAALAEGKSVPAAAMAAGFTASFGQTLHNALVARLGWQAK